MTSLLFINASYKDKKYFVDIQSFIVINIYRLAEAPELLLKVKIVDSSGCNLISVNLDDVIFEIVEQFDDEDFSLLCRWPVMILNNYVVSGLCSVARQICKASDKSDVKKLLGFREACLVACAESSIWTKFCEIDITNTINNLINNTFIQNNTFTVPQAILKYENHLSQPVRIHNIYKIARNTQNDQSLTSSTPREDLRVLHDYAEGPYITLADAILYPSFQIIFNYCQKNCIEMDIPLIKKWFKRLQCSDISKIILFNLDITLSQISLVVTPSIENVSLYNGEPSRTVSVKHTKQYKVESAFDLIKLISSDVVNSLLPYGYQRAFNWQAIPLEANPQGGSLPAKRAARKCEQLENLAKATLEVVSNKNYNIVDFCSGSGHLGILIACLLPKCKIILVENKERSLDRARETINNLKLLNIIIVQSNLDYFVGTFDLGLALHACGVATDLVLQMCIKTKADFICCPCCYGSIRNCHEVSYPRSNKFQKLFFQVENQYFNLTHAADQTHDHENAKTKQGYFCMDVIDTDRRCYAEECGYKVHLGKLQPVTCTNKNNLLVGICTKQ